MRAKEIFKVEGRYLRQQAQQTIKSDPVLAFVELITNSDVSYANLERDGKETSGEIIIQIVPKRGGESSIYEVYDRAQGMDDKEIHEKIKRIGGDVSGLTASTGGRNYFGRGLKECMIAFGKAEVRSIKNGMHYRITSLDVEIDAEVEIKSARTKDYEDLLLPNGGSGTKIRLFAKNEGISRTPQFRNLAHSLSIHYSLRDIMANLKRKVALRYGHINNQGRWITKEEQELKYSSPNGMVILEKEVSVKGFQDAKATLIVCKTEDEIPQSVERYAEERGFLICSKDAIHDVHHFGFSNHEAAGFLFGRVESTYIDHILREEADTTIINSSRDGMKWSHLFCKALDEVITEELRPLFQRESADRSSEKKKYETEETKTRVKAALNLFNKIAQEEFKETTGMAKGKKKDKGDGPVGPEKPPILPHPRPLVRVPNGFSFSPPFVRIVASEVKTITLKVELSKEITNQSGVLLSSSTNSVKIDDELLHIRDFIENQKEFEDGGELVRIVTLRTKISSDEIGAEATIIAKCENKEAMLECIVNEKSTSGGGLFSDYEFDDEAPPEQRVQYIRGAGIIKIATQAPSIKKYFGLKGEHQNSSEARSLLAELILDACCTELARLKCSQEGFFFEDDPSLVSQMFQFEINRYKNEYAHSLHEIISNK